MGLVDYSDSDSDTGSDSDTQRSSKPTASPPPPSRSAEQQAAKRPKPAASHAKLINRSATGKILVTLPSADAAATTTTSASSAKDGEPPAKRARVAEGGTSRFSGFSCFLPPPKNVGKTALSSSSSSSAAAAGARDGGSGGRATPQIGVHLKTSAEAAFSRDVGTEYGDGGGGNGDGDGGADGSGAPSGVLNLPPPRRAPVGPTIPEGQKPEAEVKLVGKPLMFKPLSVGRKPTKKKTGAVPAAATKTRPAAGVARDESKGGAAGQETPKKKTISLFSVGDEDDEDKGVAAGRKHGVYEPLAGADDYGSDGLGAGGDVFTDDGDAYAQFDARHAQDGTPAAATQQPAAIPPQQSLSAIADDLNLSEKQRRELFGRGGGPGGATKVVSFSMEREYEANEALRASGELQREQAQHNPVRSIAPGKHNLRQLVNMVQSNQAALEESFVAQRTNRREAAGRYGWK